VLDTIIPGEAGIKLGEGGEDQQPAVVSHLAKTKPIVAIRLGTCSLPNETSRLGTTVHLCQNSGAPQLDSV
jgi:hypothetical protein